MNIRGTIQAAVIGLIVLGVVGEANAGLVLTADAAGVQSSQYTNITTENFDSFATGKYNSLTTAVGTFTAGGSGLAIVGADAYGGAGGTGNYFAIGAESSSTTATLMLNGPQDYLGFWWSAADPLNSMEILSQGQVIATFDSASALGSLSYLYNGNPNNGQDSSEKFAYLNFIGTAGTTFDEIIFNNVSTETGFEADNFSVANPLGPGGSGTDIGGLSTPAPPAILMTSMGLISVTAMTKLRRGRLNRSTFLKRKVGLFQGGFSKFLQQSLQVIALIFCRRQIILNG